MRALQKNQEALLGQIQRLPLYLSTDPTTHAICSLNNHVIGGACKTSSKKALLKADGLDFSNQGHRKDSSGDADPEFPLS